MRFAALEAADRQLLRGLHHRLAAAARRAGEQLTCRLGCVECCIGLFDITALDAGRLRRGLVRLARREPRRAAAVKERARTQWAVVCDTFPGDRRSGALWDDEQAREAFFTAHQRLPCPALDPESGACDLYRARPISCRIFGLPVRCGEQTLPPCRLNFLEATTEELEAWAVDPDPHQEEAQLLTRFGLQSWDTIVAWALAAFWEGESALKVAARKPGESPRPRRR